MERSELESESETSRNASAVKVSLALTLAFGTATCVFACGAEPSASELESVSAPLSVSTAISTLEELKRMSGTGNYRLIANIDASEGLEPIDFGGSFDGQDFTIQNLNLDRSDESQVGLFGTLDGATIRNLRLTNVAVTGRSQVGALAGRSVDSSIEYVRVEGTVRSSTGAQHGDVGLLVGKLVGGSVSHCSAKGRIRGFATRVGGLIGSAVESRLRGPRVFESYSSIDLVPTTSSTRLSVIAGGLIGLAHSAVVHDVYSVGRVVGRSAGADQVVGGLIGQAGGNSSAPTQLFGALCRVNVTDQAGAWAGCYGSIDSHTNAVNLLWDTDIDQDGEAPELGQSGYDAPTLQAPREVRGGVFATLDPAWDDRAWVAGTSEQYHTLTRVAGLDVQPR
ncbi:MAG TPA: GLUG motif-containing protein [Polyangiaceae bacterium]|nr:GLUG motif-containing protein [Polyangiaceae bacterium]